jgi:hypothetical protein
MPPAQLPPALHTCGRAKAGLALAVGHCEGVLAIMVAVAIAVTMSRHEDLAVHVVVSIISIILLGRGPAVVAVVVGVEQLCRTVEEQQASRCQDRSIKRWTSMHGILCR